MSDADIPNGKYGNNSALSSREKVETKVTTDDYQSSSSPCNEEIIIQESLDPSADNTALAAISSKKESGELSANSHILKIILHTIRNKLVLSLTGLRLSIKMVKNITGTKPQ